LDTEKRFRIFWLVSIMLIRLSTSATIGFSTESVVTNLRSELWRQVGYIVDDDFIVRQ
jgi:hypothetical protein